MKHGLDCYANSWAVIITIVLIHVSRIRFKGVFASLPTWCPTRRKNTRSEPRCVFPRTRLSASETLSIKCSHTGRCLQHSSGLYGYLVVIIKRTPRPCLHRQSYSVCALHASPPPPFFFGLFLCTLEKVNRPIYHS